MTSPDNPFTRLADQQMVAATKAKHKRREVRLARSEADAPMKLGELEQKLEDQSKQMRNYRAWKRQEFDALQRRYGPLWSHFVCTVKTINPNTANYEDLLLELSWLDGTDLYTRQSALAYIANHLIRLRLESSYPPFDDSLPGEELTLFEIIRARLKVTT